jgi:ABC-2 type transport system permease protein
MFLKARMEYRFSFFAGIFSNFYCYGVTYITFWVITQHFVTIDGWVFEDMVILYGLHLLPYSLATVFVWYNVFQLEGQITSGRLDGFLIRPMGLIKQMICSRFGDTSLGQVVVSLIFISVIIANIHDRLTAFSYIYLILAIAGGTLLHMGAMIIMGSLSFWTLRSGEISNIFYYNIRTFTQYPLSLFPSFIRISLTYVLPWAIINYYPSLIILQKVQTTEELILGILSPVIGILFFLLSLFVFNRGLRRYSGSGS